MSRMRFGQRVALASVVLICGVASLAAQTPTPVPKPAAPPPVGAEPQSTTATYGDWAMRRGRTQQAEQAQARVRNRANARQSKARTSWRRLPLGPLFGC